MHLKKELDKFLNEQYTIEDLSRILSNIGVPNELLEEIAEVEYKLEKIRFCVSDTEQFKEALKIINPLIVKLEEFNLK